MATFQISYSQFALFDPSVDGPYNDWTEEHVRQGFSWRPGSVSFKTFGDGPLDVEIKRSQEEDFPSGFKRAIQVPFSVPVSGMVECGSLFETVELELPPGDYRVVFSTGVEQGRMRGTLLLEPTSDAVEPSIILSDSDLNPPSPLVMQADPA